MFYTKAPNSSIIIPRFDSIAAFDSAIKAGQKNLDALHHQQYLLMLKNDVKGMAALDAPIKDAEKDLDGLKIGLGVTMGANIHGKAGNQLTQQNDGRAPQIGKPQFMKNDTPMHVAELSDKEDKGVTNSGGGNADFFRDQRNGDSKTGGNEYPPEPQAPPRVEDIPDWENKVEQDKQEAEQAAAEKALWEESGNADFFREQREADAVQKGQDNSKADAVNKDIVDTTIDSALGSVADETGGYLLKKTEKGSLEYVAEGIPYAGMVFECFGQYFASEDSKTALLENYVNFGANLWNQQNGNEYKDALVWSPMDTFDCDQEFMDRALELQNELEVAGIAGYPDCTGMYWDDIVEDDRQTKEYNKQHPEDKKESKLDFLTTWVTNMSNPAFKDFTYEVYVPYSKIAVDSWVTIYFGNWGMNE